MSDLNDPGLTPSPLDPASLDLTGRSKSRLPLLIVLVALLAGGAFAGWRMVQTRKVREARVKMMEEFQSLEKDELGTFWNCLFGPNISANFFSDNIQLGQRIEVSFAQDPLHYPDKILDDCVPKLKDVPTKAKSLEMSDSFDEPLEKYAKSVEALSTGLSEWATRAKQRGPEREIERKIQSTGAAFHATDGKPTPEGLAYASFLRCAVSDLDQLADGQALVERLFNECKEKPEFVGRVRTDCGKLVSATDGKEDKVFKETLKKFGADDRDLQAWDNCFKKSRKGAKQDDLAAFGKAWVSYMEASGDVLKTGKKLMEE